jgi:hypothetical protein
MLVLSFQPTLQSSIVATPAPPRQQPEANTDKKTQTRYVNFHWMDHNFYQANYDGNKVMISKYFSLFFSETSECLEFFLERCKSSRKTAAKKQLGWVKKISSFQEKINFPLSRKISNFQGKVNFPEKFQISFKSPRKSQLPRKISNFLQISKKKSTFQKNFQFPSNFQGKVKFLNSFCTLSCRKENENKLRRSSKRLPYKNARKQFVKRKNFLSPAENNKPNWKSWNGK